MQRVQDGTAVAVIGNTFSSQQGTASVDAEHASIVGRSHRGTDALHRPAQFNAPQRKEVIEGCDFHFGSGEVSANLS